MEELDDDVVLPFFLSVVTDQDEDDLARIEILKLFDVRYKENNDENVVMSKALCKILKTKDDDVDVRNHAAIAASNYMDDSNVFSIVSKVLLDADEDNDMRWNAFAALKMLGKTTQSVRALKKLEDTAFAKAKKRVLEEWSA